MISGYSLLLDTHVVIWMATAPKRLPVALLKAIETVEVRFVSHVTAWEIQVKQEKYGSRFGFSLERLERTMKAFSCTEMGIDYRDIAGLSDVRSVHRDPFDRLLISQAVRRQVYLASLDANILQSFELSRDFYLFTDKARV